MDLGHALDALDGLFPSCIGLAVLGWELEFLRTDGVAVPVVDSGSCGAHLGNALVWLHPKPEILVVGTRLSSDRRFAGALLIGFAALGMLVWLAGWLSSLAEAVGVVSFCVVAILMLCDIRATRKLARRIVEEKNARSS